MPWIQRSISTPISFVRRDGIIYLTPLVFTYTPQPAVNRKHRQQMMLFLQQRINEILFLFYSI